VQFFKDILNPFSFTPSDTGDSISGGKYHHCSRNFPSCQNKGWESCRLQWNPTWNPQSREKTSCLLTRVCQVAWRSGRASVHVLANRG